MAAKVNPLWIKEAMKEYITYGKLTRTSNFNKAIQLLIMKLDAKSIPYKVYNLGAGVKKVTTETNICPCCKHNI